MSCDRKVVKESVMNRIAPGFRVVAVICLAFVITFCHNLPMLGILFAASLALFYISGQRLRFFAGRLAALWLFCLPVLLTYPFGSGGQVLFTVGKLAYSANGLLDTLALLLRLNILLLVTAALILTIEPMRLAAALRTLHLPAKLAEIILFAFRYTSVIHREAETMHKALKARGFHPGLNLHTLKTFANYLAMLLLRSLDRAERIRNAMLCRGFDGTFYAHDKLVPTRLDFAFAAASAGLIITILTLEILL